LDQLTPSLTQLLESFRPCFRSEVFATFSLMTATWIVCLGRRSVSRVWETTGLSATQDHCKAFRLFSEAVWNWDELGRILLVKLLAVFVPGSRVWLIIDDTLCHKRGANVAFGGIFRDAVLSTKKHKVFRFGNNWVTLGLAIQLPFRQDRFFCCNILWRVYAKKKDATKPEGHKIKSQLALEMIQAVAGWLPGSRFVVAADSAYMSKHLLKDLPSNVSALGPIHPKAKLSKPLAADCKDKRRKIGEELTTPREAREDEQWPWVEIELSYPGGKKKLQVKVLAGCCWYRSAGTRLLQVVLVRDPQKKWRDEALLCGDLEMSVEEVIAGYLRRWSVEVAYCESKQMLGLHDPMVYSEASVSRAHPMAWFVGSVVVLWYASVGRQEKPAKRHRPWYKEKVEPTMADMLSCCRQHLWRNWLQAEPEKREEKLDWLLEYIATAA
jgi:DDE superfamily endonuclease